MEIDFTNKDLIDTMDMVHDTYAHLLMQKHLIERGVPTENDKQQLEDLIFNCARVLVKLNRKVHELGLCQCTDDRAADRMELIFNQEFGEQMKTEEFLERIEAHGGFQVASPQLPTSYQPSQKAEAKWQPELNTQRESGEAQEKKRRRTL